MSKQRKLVTQSVWDFAMLQAAFEEISVKEIHAARLLSHLVRHPDADWADVPDLPKAAIELLSRSFSKSTSKVVSCKTSANGETTKLLVQLQDGLEVEAVIMRYDTTGRFSEDTDENSSQKAQGHKRGTLCVSSQVGCQMGCTFCATGTMGLKGNLTAGEIVEQLVHAKAVAGIRNIVFMGMGEPLMNYEQVKTAVGTMTDSRLFALSKKHVTVSTVGIVPRIVQLAQDLPGVSLALSLHAPTQELRQQIVPSARAYKLPKLMEAVQKYQEASGQRIFIEYVVLAGVNDGLEQAQDLGQLLKGRDVVVNLIPWNPIYSPNGPVFQAPSSEAITAFQLLLRTEYDIHCTIRQEKGQDIGGACGQLVIEHGNRSCSGEAKVGDIEELAAKSPAQHA